MMKILSPATATLLRQSIAGRVVLPTDPGFDAARCPWNLAVDQPVCAVVEAADARDVATLMRIAAGAGVAVAAQPSGHGASGRTDGAILLRTGRLDQIMIDPGRRIARIGVGVRSGALQQAAAAYGLTALPGSSPVVSVAGAALGGGLSWFSRAYGWMADSIVAADVATPEGHVQHVTMESDPELLWALRGGGGDVAVVTALEIRLRSVPGVHGGRTLWSGVHARDVAECFRDITVDAPEALTLWLEFLEFPGSDPMVAIDSTYLGEVKGARHLMRALDKLPTPVSDSRAMMSVADLGTITNEPTQPGAGASYGALLGTFDDAAIRALARTPIAPLMTVQVRHLGGALTRPSDSPHGPLDEPYAIYMFGVPTDAEIGAAITMKQASLASSLPITGRKPISFLNPSEGMACALPPASIRRLRRLKAQRDPAGLVRGNFSIPTPAAPSAVMCEQRPASH